MEEHLWREIQLLKRVKQMDKINLTVIRHTFGNVVYTHKTHEKAAEICIFKSRWIKRINVVLLALTSGTAVSSIFVGQIYSIVTAVLSTLALFFVVYQLSFNFEGKAKEHKMSAKELWLIREKYQYLIADIMNENYSLKDLVEKRDLFQEKLYEILQRAPQTDHKAYSKARKALKIHEEMKLSDKEIDSFLPVELRIEKKS